MVGKLKIYTDRARKKKKTGEITHEDLYSCEGITRRLNIEKLEWCMNNGIDNKDVREAIREKEKIDKYKSATVECEAKINYLLEQARAESKKFNILRRDDPQTRANKKAQKEKIWAEYFKKKAKFNPKKEMPVPAPMVKSFLLIFLPMRMQLDGDGAYQEEESERFIAKFA